MSIEKQYKAGTVARIETYIRDRDDLLADPTTIKLTVTDPSSVVVVSAEDMTKISTGYYYYNWQMAGSEDAGLYDVLIVATSGVYTVKKQILDAFEIVA